MSYGRPQILIRVHPQAYEMLQARADEANPGQPLASYCRAVLYDHLQFDSGEFPVADKRRKDYRAEDDDDDPD